MVFDRKRKLILGGTATAVLVAGGVYASTAFAQSTPASSPPSATATASASGSAAAKPRANNSTFLSHLASRLNISQDQLSAAMKGAAHDAVNDAVAAGKLTQQQATQINQRIDSGQSGRGFGFGFGGPGGPKGSGAAGPRGAFGGGQGLQAAATALNMQTSDLMQQLRSGKTLAQIAQAQNVQLSTVTTAITNAVKPQLDQAVQSGRLTQQQENDILSRISSGEFPGPRPGGQFPRGSARPPAAPSTS